jgi:hypothetical protein
LNTARRSLAAAAATLLLGAVMAVDPAGPTSVAAAPLAFTIDDASDAVDELIDGSCRTAAGTCTLRAAVQEANAAGGTTEIRVDAAVAELVLDLEGDGGAEVGDLEIAAGVDVQLFGNEVSSIAVTEVGAHDLSDRHFDVLAGGRLELVQVHLTGGRTDGDGGSILNEGRVVVRNQESTTASYRALSDNAADGSGGAVANRPGASLDILNLSTHSSVTRVDVVDNSAGVDGGAIANLGGSVRLEGDTSPTAHDVYVDSSTAVADGGGVHNTLDGWVTIGCRSYVRFSSAVLGGNVSNEQGTVTVAAGGVDGGSATDGGGIHNATDGTVRFATSPCGSGLLARSTASGAGGAIHNEGSVVVDAGANVNVSGAGAGADAPRGAGILQAGGTIQIAGSLWVSTVAATVEGGGVHVRGGSVTTVDDGLIQVSDSSGAQRGGGILVESGQLSAKVVLERNGATDGGGIAVVSTGQVDLHHSALIDNQAERGSAAFVSGSTATLDVVNTTAARNSSPSAGGAFVVTDDASLVLRHVTVADNAPAGVWSDATVDLQRVLMARNSSANCAGGAASAGDFNVFDDPSCAPTGSDLTDTGRFAEVASGLDAVLADGAALSFELDVGHPAIDVVSDEGCGDPADDQNGSPRPVDGDGSASAECDAGAVEAAQVDSVRGVEGTVYDEATGLPLPRACVFLGRVDGEDDDAGDMARADDQGRYRGEVPQGTYLIGFFVPLGDVDGPEGCGGEGIDTRYQPEWYRNVAIEFTSDDPDSDVQFPDLADVQLVTVAGADITGIDACLGSGPGAGSDAPCTQGSGPDDGPPTPAPSTPTGSAAEPPPADTEADAARRIPRSLAFTGGGGPALSISLLLLLAGTACLLVERRRVLLARRPARVRD